MTIELTLDIELSRTSIPVTNQPQLVYVLLETRPTGALRATRLPVNINLVVDRSESMCIPILTDEQFKTMARRADAREVVVDGIPVWQFRNVPPEMAANAPRSLDFVKEALRNVLERLGAHDRFSLVAFAGRARRLIENQSGANKRRLLEAIDQLDDLELGDETYMAQGMALGFEEAAGTMSQQTVSRMIIFTDGFTLDADDCLRWAKQATARGLPISTIGLGVEFNENLMIKIADMSGGNAYFAHDPQVIPQIFAQELSGAQSVALRDLELKIRLANGVELRRAYRVKPVISNLGQIKIVDRSFSLPLGDMEENSTPSVLLELIAPPRVAGRYRLAHAVLAYDGSISGSRAEKVRGDVIVDYQDDPRAGTQVNPTVMNIAEKVSAHKLQTRALEEAEAGDIAGATTKLRAAYTRLLNMGEEELAQAALQEAENLQRQGQLSGAGTKKLRYETRKLTQKLD